MAGKPSEAVKTETRSNPQSPKANSSVKGLVNTRGNMKAPSPGDIRRARDAEWKEKSKDLTPEQRKIANELRDKYTDDDTMIAPKAIHSIKTDKNGKVTRCVIRP